MSISFHNERIFRGIQVDEQTFALGSMINICKKDLPRAVIATVSIFCYLIMKYRYLFFGRPNCAAETAKARPLTTSVPAAVWTLAMAATCLGEIAAAGI